MQATGLQYEWMTASGSTVYAGFTLALCLAFGPYSCVSLARNSLTRRLL